MTRDSSIKLGLLDEGIVQLFSQSSSSETIRSRGSTRIARGPLCRAAWSAERAVERRRVAAGGCIIAALDAFAAEAEQLGGLLRFLRVHRRLPRAYRVHILGISFGDGTAIASLARDRN